MMMMKMMRMIATLMLMFIKEPNFVDFHHYSFLMAVTINLMIILMMSMMMTMIRMITTMMMMTMMASNSVYVH